MLFRRPLALRTIHTYILRQPFTTACADSRICHGRSRCLPSPSHRHQQCRAAQSAADVVTEPAMSPGTSKTQLPAPARRLVHTEATANLLFRCLWQAVLNLCVLQKTSTFGCSAYRNPSSWKLLRRHTQLGQLARTIRCLNIVLMSYAACDRKSFETSIDVQSGTSDIVVHLTLQKPTSAWWTCMPSPFHMNLKPC